MGVSLALVPWMGPVLLTGNNNCVPGRELVKKKTEWSEPLVICRQA